MQYYENDREIDSQFLCRLRPYAKAYLDSILSNSSENFLKDLSIHLDEKSGIYYNWKEYKNISINITKQLDYHKTFFFKHSPYKESIAKAIGLKKGQEKPKIIDLTGGMLSDSLLIYSLAEDIELEIWERNPLVALLIEDALKQYNLKINFHFGEFLERYNVGDFLTHTTLYYDPMYQITNKKTAAKKEMMFFREGVGADLDAENNAKKLLGIASRLVIKRSIKAEPLLEKPTHSILGKSTAYDVYLCSNGK